VERVTPVVATVGTTHPYAATGMLLDLTALAALGVRPVAVVAGVSAQDAGRVLARRAVDPATIAAQFDALAAAGVAACAVGALLDPASVAAVAAGLARLGAPAFADPVIAASGGDRLADDATIAAIRVDLLPRCALVAPNLHEAALLAGRPLRSLADVHAALPALLALGPHAVLVTGGHLDGDPCDVLADGERVVELRAPRLPYELRGTGSLLVAAIAAHVARGASLARAVDDARTFVRERIAAGVPFAGMRVAF